MCAVGHVVDAVISNWSFVDVFFESYLFEIGEFVCCRKKEKGKPLSQIEKLEVMVRSACKC